MLAKKRAKSRNRICGATDSDEGGEENSTAGDDSKTFDTMGSADLTTGSTKDLFKLNVQSAAFTRGVA